MEATVTLITLTGGRPEAFALCERYMARQTYGGAYQWIVVDDCLPHTLTTYEQTVIRPEPPWSGTPTQYRNLAVGLAAATGDFIVMIEDDEWYGPQYLESLLCRLRSHVLVGETPSRYYHVGMRLYRDMGNRANASLSQTGFRRELIPAVVNMCRHQLWIDMNLWRMAARNRISTGLYAGNQVVGIKGMPGRPGMSTAHRPCGPAWRPDPCMEQLRRWMGEEAQTYAEYYHGT